MNKRDHEPRNIQAEEALLGAFIIDEHEAARKVNGRLKPEHFYLKKHTYIYEAIRTLQARGDPIDFVLLTTELEKRGYLQTIGGAAYLVQLSSIAPSAIHAGNYANEIYDTWRRRHLLSLLGDISKIAHNEGEDLAQAADTIQAQLSELLHTQQDRRFQNFASIAATLTPIEWTWKDWMPRGMITLLGAVPGAGKSMIALDLAKRIIHGEPFPDGQPNLTQRKNVIYVDAELVPQLLKARAEAWGLDYSRLFLMLPRPNDMIDFGRDEYRKQLHAMIQQVDPELVIIDSLSSVSIKGENNVEDIRGIMGFFNEIASTYNISLLLIHHLRKRGGQQMGQDLGISIDDFRGSSHIIAMSRSVMGLSVVQAAPGDNNHNGPRKMEIVKTNLAAYPQALGCEFLPLHPEGVFLKWTRDAPKPYREPTKAELCMAWIKDMLTSGPMSPAELVDAGKNEGFSRATVYRARKDLGNCIEDTDGRQSPNNKWALKEKEGSISDF